MYFDSGYLFPFELSNMNPCSPVLGGTWENLHMISVTYGVSVARELSPNIIVVFSLARLKLAYPSDK